MRVESRSGEFDGLFRLGNGISIVDAETGEALECSSVAKVEDDRSISQVAIRLELLRPDGDGETVTAGVWLSIEEADELIASLQGAVEELRSGEFEAETQRQLA